MQRLALLVCLLLAACESGPDARTSYTGPLPPGAQARLGKGVINDLVFSPNGRFLAVADSVGLTLYQTDSLEESWLAPSSSPVLTAAFSPDGRFLAGGLQDSSLVLLDANNGQVLRSLSGNDEENGVNALAWTADEDGQQQLAAGFNDGNVILTTVDGSATELVVDFHSMLERHNSGVTSLGFSPNGRFLATGNRTGIINLWDVQTSEWVAALEEHALSQAVLSLQWSGDGTQLLSGGRDGLVVLWDATTLLPHHTLAGHRQDVLDVTFLSEIGQLASASQDGSIYRWHGEQSTVLNTADAFSDEIVSVAWSPDNAIYATASGDGTLAVWSLAETAVGEKPLSVLTGHSQRGRWVNAIAWSPDGQQLASGLGNDVAIWQADNTRLHLLSGHEGLVTSVAWSPDGTMLASGSREGIIMVWDAERGERRLQLTGHTDSIPSLTWSPDGHRLASAGALDDSVIIWDVDQGEALHTLHSNSGNGIWSVAWSPDGKTLAAGTTRGSVLLWHVDDFGSTGESEVTLGRHLDWVAGLAWSPDSSRLASASADTRVVIWDIESDNSTVLVGHSDVVRDVTFSPGGDHLASAARDKLVILWDVSPGADRSPQEILTGHADGVNTVAWSPDGTLFATGSDDGTVILWQE